MVDRLGPLFDPAAIRWVQSLFGTEARIPFTILSLLGDTWGMLLVFAIAFWRYGPDTARDVAIAVVLASPLWLALSSLFAVDRPDAAGIVVMEQLEAGAFPSGHVFHAMVAWGVLVARTGLPLWIPPAAGVATGMARIYMGVHFPADVLASLLLGPLFVLAFQTARERLPLPRARVSARTELLLVVLLLAIVAVAVAGPLEPARLRRWEIAGVAFGAPIAWLLHRRLVGVAERRITGATVTCIALAAMAAFALAARVILDHVLVSGAILMALAILWIVIAAPAVLGSRQSVPPRSPPA